MTLPSALAVAAALAFVLGVLALSVRLLRGLVPAARTDGIRMEVLGRVGVAPRQGVAAVRMQGRTFLVSFGEGGVRYLTELRAEDGESENPRTEEDCVAAPPPRRSGFGQALERLVDAVASPHPGAQPVQEGLQSAPGPTREGHARPVVWRRKKAPLKSGEIAIFAALALGIGACPLSAADHVFTPLAATTPTAFKAGAGALPAPFTALAAQAAGQGPERAAPVDAAEAAARLLSGGAPSIDLTVGAGREEPLRLSGPVGTVIFIGFLTLLPTLLLLMTSFTRILIVLHLLKQALGTQTAPPAHLLAALSLLLTGFVMGPTLTRVNDSALTPWMDGRIEEAEMFRRASVPFRDFMLATVREQDLATFIEMRPDMPPPETVDDIPLVVLTTAFVTSELRNAFQMGFAIFLPFVVIDVVVASVLMSMGMFMLPPVMVSLPFKLLLFVLVDGWSLTLGSLVQSFN